MSDKRPGDLILDRYMAHASVEEREAARENLRRLARLIIRVHRRLTATNAIRANEEGAVESGA
jgi:hypothetical protein